MIWPFALSWFFIALICLLILLFIIERYTPAFKKIIRLLIQAVSVVLFLWFVWYISTLLLSFCSDEVNQTIVIAVVLGISLFVGLFYYMR